MELGYVASVTIATTKAADEEADEDEESDTAADCAADDRSERSGRASGGAGGGGSLTDGRRCDASCTGLIDGRVGVDDEAVDLHEVGHGGSVRCNERHRRTAKVSGRTSTDESGSDAASLDRGCERSRGRRVVAMRCQLRHHRSETCAPA